MNLGSETLSRRSVVPASPLQASGAYSRFASPSSSRGAQDRAGALESAARNAASASGRMPSASSTLAADSDMNLSAALGFDVEGDDSAVFDNPRDLGVPSASDRAFFVREETERVASLERMNFDLKMKVFYMEEQMRKLSDSAGQEDAADELREQNNQLRGDLEERTLEVEQRNALLVKAKQAIEALKAEVAKLRSEDSSGSAARLEEAESRVRAALRNAEAMEAKHAADCERLQLKISSLEQTLALKDQLLSSVDDKAKASTSSLSSVSAELDSAHATIAKLEDQCRSYQKKLQEINQQLIDCRSDCDIAQIELAEQIDVCNSLSQRAEELRAAGLRAREELARTQAEAARSEQELKKRLDSTTTEYESLLQAAKASAEQDVAKMAAAHAIFIQELKETHERELQRKDELMRSTRGLEGSDLLRLKEDLQNRLREKTDELRMLQNTVEIERTRTESFRREAEHAKHEARDRLQSIDQLKAELVTMEVLREQLRGAKEALQRETAERIHAVSKIEALSDALETSRNATRELETECNALNNEIATLRSDLTSSRKSGESLQELTRENERLKASASSLREEVRELSEAGLVHQTEVKGMKEMIGKYSAELERTRSALKASDAHGEYVEGLLTEEKVRAAAAEATVGELRVLCDRMKVEIESERSARAEMEKHHQEAHKRIDTMSKDSEDLLVLLLGALLEWDNALGAVDPDTSSPSSLLMSPSGRKLSSTGETFRDSSMYIREARLVLKDRTMDSGDLTKMSIVRIEKVRSKMERLLKLKSNVEVQFNQVTSNVTFKFDSLLDKVKLLGHRVTAAESRCGSIGAVIEKEYKKRSVESEENKSFREMVLSQHSQQVQSLTEAMERERNAAANLRAELEAKRREVEDLSQQVSVIETAESSVRDLTAKFNEVVESNRLLMLELNDRNAKYDKMRKEFSTISAEHSVVVQKLSEKELEASRLAKDVEYLRAREIDPELERTFRETQSIMKSYRSGGTGGSPVSRGGDSFSHGGGGAFGTVIDRVAMLARSAESLVQSTSGVIDQYARWISGQRHGNSVDHRRLAEEVVEMLDRNHRLSMQLRDLTTELRRVAWSINEDREAVVLDRPQVTGMRFGSDRDDRFDEEAFRLGTGGSTGRVQPPSPPSSSQNGGSAAMGFVMSPFAAPQSHSHSGDYGAPRDTPRSEYSSDRRRMNDSMPQLASPQFASSQRSNSASYGTTEPPSNSTYSSSHYAASGRTVDTAPINSSSTSAQFERRDFHAYSDELDASRIQPLPQSLPPQPRSLPTSSAFSVQPPALSITTSSSSQPPSLAKMSAASPIPSVAFASPRTSSNRLARLSEDLQTLAKKLDGFDASRPRF